MQPASGHGDSVESVYPEIEGGHSQAFCSTVWVRCCGEQPHLLPQRPSAVLSSLLMPNEPYGSLIHQPDMPETRRGLRSGMPVSAGEDRRVHTRGVTLVWKLEEHAGWVESVQATDLHAVHQSELTESTQYFFSC